MESVIEQRKYRNLQQRETKEKRKKTRDENNEK